MYFALLERRAMPMVDHYMLAVYYIAKLLIELIGEHKKNRPIPDKK